MEIISAENKFLGITDEIYFSIATNLVALNVIFR